MTLNLSDFMPTADLATAKTMPARWYTDPAFLGAEKEKIFWKTWQPVCNASLLMRVGDYVSVDLVGEPLVITRTKAGELKAFSNVCRHRGAQVARGKGNRKSLQCHYHGWTYDLDGKLINAPEFEGVKDWQKEEVCLPAVRCEQWGPWIFVNLDPNAPPMQETCYGDIMAEILREGFNINQMTSIERRDYDIACNWKVYVDNYLEGYHLPTAHPDLFREVDYDKYEVVTYADYSKQFAPIREIDESDARHRDRRYVRTDEESKALYFWIFPNVMLNVYMDNVSINIILPTSHERTLTIFEWFFEQPGTGAGWESMQNVIQFSDQIQQEDIEICEIVQKGLQSRTYHQGRFSVLRENGVHHFQTLVHDYLSK